MSNNIGAVFSVKDEFSGQIDDIINKTGKAEGALDKATNKVGGFGNKVKKGAKVVAGVSGVLAGMGTAAFAATNKMVGGFDNIAKTAPKLGITTDAYQEMDYWAGQNGISTGNMEKAVGRLNQRIGAAKSGNEKYSNALTNLGVNMDDVKNGTLSTEDAMAQSIKGLSEMTNEQDKAAMASELFGTKLGRELMPALQDGSLSLEDAKKKAEELGIVIDGETLEAAEVFADTWDDLTRTMGVFGQKILADLMPIFQTMMEWVIDKMPLIKDTIAAAFANAWYVIETVFNKIKPGLQVIKEKLGEVYEFVSSNWTTVENVIKGVGDSIKYVWEKAKDMYNFIVNNWGAIGPVVAGVVGAMVAYQAIVFLSSTWTAILAAKSAILTATQGGLAGIQATLNAVMAANPMAMVAIAIGLLIAGGVALYKNWDKVKAKTQELWDKFKETKFMQKVREDMETLGRTLSNVGNFFQGVKDKFDSFKNAISKFKVPKWVSTIGGKLSGATRAAENGAEESYAVGTNKVPRDMLANIHKGEMIIPARQSQNLRQQGVHLGNIDKGSLNKPVQTTKVVSSGSGSNVTIAKLADQIIIREEADIDKLAKALVRNIKRTQLNMA